MIGFKVALTILRHIASLPQPPYPLFTSGLPCAPLPMADDLRAVADRRDFGAQVYCYHEGKMVMRTRVGKSLNPSHKKKRRRYEERVCLCLLAHGRRLRCVHLSSTLRLSLLLSAGNGECFPFFARQSWSGCGRGRRACSPCYLHRYCKSPLRVMPLNKYAKFSSDGCFLFHYLLLLRLMTSSSVQFECMAGTSYNIAKLLNYYRSKL